MASEIVKALHISLAKLLKLYLQENSETPQIKATHKWSLSLLKQCKLTPDLLFSQPQLYKSQLPYINNLAFNACIYTALIAVRNKVDESVSIQMIGASLSIIANNQLNIHECYIEKKAQSLNAAQHSKKFLKCLKQFNQSIWLDGYSIYSYMHKKSPSEINQLNHFNSMLYLANRLAILCTVNNQHKALKFSQALKKLSIDCPSHYYELLNPLLIYPSLIPPGSFVKRQDGSLHIVLAVTKTGLISKAIQAAKDEYLDANNHAIKQLETAQLNQWYSSQSINNLRRLDNWWNEELDNYFHQHSSIQTQQIVEKRLPFQSPPAPLLIIQDQLTNINTDISVVIKAIEKEPNYTRQLQHAASTENRQKKTVESLQHGLAMLGYHRANSILLEHSLLSRLNQEHFPLQKPLILFSALLAAMAAEMANKTKLIPMEEARTTAYFLISRLFTLPSIRTQLRWKRGTEKHYNLVNLIVTKGNESLKNDGVLLAKAWQQEKSILAALEQYDGPINKKAHSFSAILGTSLIVAKQYYFSDTGSCEATQQYLAQSLSVLKISKEELKELAQQACEKIVCYSALK